MRGILRATCVAMRRMRLVPEHGLATGCESQNNVDVAASLWCFQAHSLWTILLEQFCFSHALRLSSLSKERQLRTHLGRLVSE